jgi:hypothetical protein
VHPPRPRRRPTGPLRSGCMRAVGGARHAGSDGASSLRSRIAMARRSHLHGSSPVARRRARTSLPSARRQDHGRRGDAGTCVRHRSGDRRSARTPLVHLANVLGNQRPKQQRPHPDCARSASASFIDNGASTAPREASWSGSARSGRALSREAIYGVAKSSRTTGEARTSSARSGASVATNSSTRARASVLAVAARSSSPSA